MWMFDTPNPLSPRSDILAFLMRSEDYMDCPEWQRAVARVRQMLALKDRTGVREAALGGLGVDGNGAVAARSQEQVGGFRQIDGDESRKGRSGRQARGGAGSGIFVGDGLMGPRFDNDHVARHSIDAELVCGLIRPGAGGRSVRSKL
jgi:hypothetical protein